MHLQKELHTIGKITLPFFAFQAILQTKNLSQASVNPFLQSNQMSVCMDEYAKRLGFPDGTFGS